MCNKQHSIKSAFILELQMPVNKKLNRMNSEDLLESFTWVCSEKWNMDKNKILDVSTSTCKCWLLNLKRYLK